LPDSDLTAKGSPALEADASAAFVLCIENNETRGQALLLIESLRQFGGRFAKSPVFAVAPRRGLGVDAATRARLEELEATYHEEVLNTACPEYGSANRVYAAAWASRTSSAETLFVLDSDTLFLGEPEELGPGWDLAVRPVDVKGATSEGEGDPFEAYWTAVCGLAGISVDSLPFVETVLDRRRVRASYNGGYSVVRRASGILERSAELFTRSVAADLRPYQGVPGHRVFSSTGYVEPRAGEYWGSNQAALSIAAWSTTQRVRLLDRRFNVPVHELSSRERWTHDWENIRPVHVHYHWLLRARHRDLALATLAKLGVAPSRLDWIRERATLIEVPPAPASAHASPKAGCAARPLVISGMHRSGTSLVASALQQAGLEIGDQLMGPGPGNRRGHFEDQDFFLLHEEMLGAIGSTALIGVEEMVPPAGEEFEARARDLVQRRQEIPLWGWKDPRTCLFLDFWERQVPDANYLFLYRHPLEVALSLRRRFTDPEVQLDPWAGLRAWGVYNRYLLRFVERHPGRCFLAQVPALTLDLRAFVHRVAEKFALALDEGRITSLFAPAELATDLAGGHLSPAWQALIPESLELYRRLEAVADLPAREIPKPRRREESATLDSLYQDLCEARMHREPIASGSQEQGEAAIANGSRGPELDARWTVVERRFLGTVLAEVVERRKAVAELEAGVESAATRRDELAATLAAIEGSRSFALVAGGWRFFAWLRRLGRRKPD
jgi:hypothetical protein